MMNIFDCTRHYDSLEEALSFIKAKLTLIAFSGDVLFPPVLMKEMQTAMQNIGRSKQVDFSLIDSDYGHDAFLVETEKFDFIITKALQCKI